MPILVPSVPTPRESFEMRSWIENECFRFYARQRRAHCTYMELMDLWVRAPCCDECIQSEVFYGGGVPDIGSDDGWLVDILLHLGPRTAQAVEAAVDTDDDFAFSCKRCGDSLCPWNGDDVYVLSYHLEEHYGIPTETGAKRQVSERMRNTVSALYDNRCFACGSGELELHIDHVMPQSLGGDAAFRNLQPLCEGCGNRKGATLPRQVAVFSDMYFVFQPGDSYDGLFW